MFLERLLKKPKQRHETNKQNSFSSGVCVHSSKPNQKKTYYTNSHLKKTNSLFSTQHRGTHKRHEPSALADANRPVESVDKDKTESCMMITQLGAVCWKIVLSLDLVGTWSINLSKTKKTPMNNLTNHTLSRYDWKTTVDGQINQTPDA